MNKQFLMYALLFSVCAMHAMQDSAGKKKNDIYVKGLEPGHAKDYPNHGVIDLEKQREATKSSAQELVAWASFINIFGKEEFYDSFNMWDETPYGQKYTKPEEEHKNPAK